MIDKFDDTAVLPSPGTEPVTTTTGAAGEFVLSNVPPGDYVVHAIRFAGLGLRAEIGSAHVALVLQPDGPFALCAPGGARAPSKLIAYSARVGGGVAWARACRGGCR